MAAEYIEHEPTIVEDADVPENSDRRDEDGNVWPQAATLKLTLTTGEEVQIVLRYHNASDAIAALHAVNKPEYLLKLAVGIGAVNGLELDHPEDDD